MAQKQMRTAHEKRHQLRFSLVMTIAASAALIIILGFVSWRVYEAVKQHLVSQTSQPKPTDSTAKTTSSVFKIPELAVEFDVKGGITVLDNYSVNDTFDTPP